MFKRWLMGIGVVGLVLSTTFAQGALAQDSTLITPQNAAQLELQARLGRGSMNGQMGANEANGTTLIVPTSLGLYIWDLTTPDAEPRLIETPNVMSAVISPNGEFVAGRAWDGTFRIWEVATGNLTTERNMPPPQAIGSGGIAWAADSSAVAVGTWDDTASIFDPRTGEGIAGFSSGITIEVQGYVDPAETLMISPDGSRLVWGNSGARLELVDVENRTTLATVAVREGDYIVGRMAWSQDSQFFVAACSDGLLRIWNGQTGELITELEGSLAGAMGNPFQPGTSELLMNENDVLRFYDVATGEFTGTIHDDTSNFAWSPDGSQFVLAGAKGARVFNAAVGEVVQQLSNEDASDALLVWSPDGRYLKMQREGMVQHWDVTTGEIVGGTVGGGAIWLNGSAWLAYFNSQTQEVWVVNIADGSPVGTLGGFSQTAELLYWDADGLRMANSAFFGGVSIVTNAAGDVLHTLFRTDEISEYGFIETYSMAWTLDGTRLATISPNGGVKVWTLDDNFLNYDLRLDAPDPNNAAFSPDGTLMLTTGWDNVARVYDLTTREQLHLLRGFDEPTSTAAFSPDGQYAAVGSYDETVRVYDTATWQEIATLPDYNYAYGGRNIAFSPDSQFVAYASRHHAVSTWAIATQTQHDFLENEWLNAISIAFSPDGALIVTGSYDEGAQVWDATTGELLISLNAPEASRDRVGQVNAVIFSPDGTQLAIAAGDGTVQLWGVPAE